MRNKKKDYVREKKNRMPKREKLEMLIKGEKVNGTKIRLMMIKIYLTICGFFVSNESCDKQHCPN